MIRTTAFALTSFICPCPWQAQQKRKVTKIIPNQATFILRRRFLPIFGRGALSSMVPSPFQFDKEIIIPRDPYRQNLDVILRP